MFTVRTNGIDFSRPNGVSDSDAAFAMVDAIEAQCQQLEMDFPLIEIVESDGTVFWSNAATLQKKEGAK